MACLYADGLRHGIGHGAVVKGAEQPALAVHGEIARGPDGRCAYIAGEDGVFCGKFVQNFCDVLWMNGRAARLADGEVVEALARVLVMIEAYVEIGAVGLVVKKRRQCRERVFYV